MPRRRFTEAEDAAIREDWDAYVPVEEIARKIGRDYGTTRQRIFHLGLRRSGDVSRCLTWAPPHLRARFGTIPNQAFVDACLAWRVEQDAKARAAVEAEHVARSKAVLAQCAAIDQRHDLTRKEKMQAKRLAGLTLDAIGEQHGITRERVRQITTLPVRESKFGRPLGVLNRNKMEILEHKRQKLLEAEVKHLLNTWYHAAAEARTEFLRQLGLVYAAPVAATEQQRNFNFFPQEDDHEHQD